MINKKIVNLLIDHEDHLKRLYLAFSLYLQNKDFWVKIANEEESHKNMLKNILNEIENENAFMDDRRFKEQAINLSIRHIKDKIEDANNQKNDLSHALSISLDLENALIEKNFFEICEGDSAKVIDMLKAMQAGISEHIKTVKEEINKYKKE